LGAFGEEPLFNVDRSYRKLLCYVSDINQFWREFGFTQTSCDFNELYAQGCSFVSRRQAVDGTTILHCDLSAVIQHSRSEENGVALVELAAIGYAKALHALMFDPETQLHGYTGVLDCGKDVSSKEAVDACEFLMYVLRAGA